MALISKDLDLALTHINQGKPVAIPTETVYGLAATINQPEAINAVFAMKGRPLNHPLIVHVHKSYDVSLLAHDIPLYAKELMRAFWPGPLTLVLPCRDNAVLPLITGGQNTVAIRAPAHPLTEELLARLQVPLVAPSANPFKKISPTMPQHVEQAFTDTELLILDGGRCTIGIESTIVDATNPDSYKILRHGVIDETHIQKIVSTDYSTQSSSIRAPGKLDTHYQPQKKLYYFTTPNQLHEFCNSHQGQVFAISAQKPDSVADSLYYPLAKTPEEVAFDLYYQLRKADESCASIIAIELPTEQTKWLGIRERILKAGSHF